MCRKLTTHGVKAIQGLSVRLGNSRPSETRGRNGMFGPT